MEEHSKVRVISQVGVARPIQPELDIRLEQVIPATH